MDLNEQQRRALEHAHDVLAKDPRPHRGPLTAQWHTEVRLALLDVLKAFAVIPEEGGQE